MTFKERLMQESTETLANAITLCPKDFGYEKMEFCPKSSCEACWNREMPEESNHATHD